MAKHSRFLIVPCTLAALLACADTKRPLTTAEKIEDAELIVHGVATLQGLPLPKTREPVEVSCKVVVLETLWPTNRPATNPVLVDVWAWAQWPDSIWRYNSQTGVYFLLRTTTAFEKFGDEGETRPTFESGKMDDNVFGTNYWYPVNRRVGDWYEPETKIAVIRQMIEETKREILPEINGVRVNFPAFVRLFEHSSPKAQKMAGQVITELRNANYKDACNTLATLSQAPDLTKDQHEVTKELTEEVRALWMKTDK